MSKRIVNMSVAAEIAFTREELYANGRPSHRQLSGVSPFKCLFIAALPVSRTLAERLDTTIA